MNQLIDPIMVDESEKEFLDMMSKNKRGAALEEIDCLDLSMVKMKLCLPKEKEGKGWTPGFADDCEKFYKMFLKLHVLTDRNDIVPTKTIDEMWHAHILDTRKYHEDCQTIFGHYLHHFPYFGLRGEQDAKNLKAAFAKSEDLFMRFFGTSHSDLSSLCDGGCAGGGCSGGGGTCS